MPTPGPGVAISFSQVNTEFGLTTPSPMNAKYRFPTSGYTPTTPAIPTTASGIFPVDSLHGRTKVVPVSPFVTSYTTPTPSTPYTTTWTSTLTGNIKVLVVGGGGGGASGNNRAGGGGGAGGVCYNAAFPVVLGTVYNITVGGGGAGGVYTPTAPSIDFNGKNGGDSSFSTVVGKGGGYGSCAFTPASPGGCGGGGGQDTRPGGGGPTVNTTTTQPTSGSPGTNYGTPGQIGRPAFFRGGGGGGAGAAASNTPTANNAGGPGVSISITGAAVTYAGGGGGGYQTSGNLASTGGAGGAGGGGAGSQGAANATPGTPGLGGGGGGGTSNPGVWSGGNGGSGIVIIAYP